MLHQSLWPSSAADGRTMRGTLQDSWCSRVSWYILLVSLMPDETSEDFIEIDFPFHYCDAHNLKQCNVPRINEITYNTFFENFLRPNKPCIVTGTFWENWLASKKWVRNGRPALDYLKNNYGEYSVSSETYF